MEEVLDLYQLPYDPEIPLVCMDEASKQLVRETRVPLLMQPGTPARYDYAYARAGTANLFLFSAPLLGWRHVKVTHRRTKQDWAHVMRELLEVHFPHAHKIRVVLDNLNLHAPGSFYDTFPPEEAHRLLDRLEFHYTPKHGSWLNMAEIEFSALARQCLDRRIPDQDTLVQQITAWQAARNDIRTTTSWRFTTQDARFKLKHLYPRTILPPQPFISTGT